VSGRAGSVAGTLVGGRRIQRTSTVTPLAGNGVYTDPGTNNDVLLCRRWSGLVSSDVAGSLALQESSDNATWYTIQTIAVVGGTPQAWNKDISGRFIRMVYTNGAGAQATFELTDYVSTNL
jgi:hypothetical protein